MLIALVVWLLISTAVGVLAAARGRSFLGFFLISALVSPLLGWVLALVLPNLKCEAQQARQARQRDDAVQRQLGALQSQLRSLSPPPVPSHKERTP